MNAALFIRKVPTPTSIGDDDPRLHYVHPSFGEIQVWI